jgi:hypothetical protein
MEKNALMMCKNDNVAIVIVAILKGDKITLPDNRVIVAVNDIPCYHKIAVHDIPAKQNILRYGEPIGYATVFIPEGSWVHVHNLDAADIM